MSEIQRVFLVDDQPDIRMIGARALRHGTPWEVVALEGGRACLDALEARPPDLILLDVMMPGLDGPTTLLRLREAGCDAPVILMTARVGRRVERDYRGSGALGVIAKPFDPLTLVAQVRELLGEAGAYDPPDDDEEEEDLSRVFVAALGERLARIRQALAASPVDESGRAAARRVAHVLAGSSGSFGFHELGAKAGELEQALDAPLASIDWSRVRETRRELERLVAGLEPVG